MALTKPILNSVPAWDVSLGQVFTFAVIGGDQVVGSTLYISDNESGTLVYTQTIASFKYEITVPANAPGLINGGYYNAYVETTNSNGDTSVASNTIQFYCYTTPIWGFTNVSQGATVTNSTFVPEVSYSQVENEPLSSYIITLYNASQTQIGTSGLKYVSTSEIPLTVSYMFSGLEDSTAYYIRAVGQTVNNTVIDTGYIRFTVQYITPSAYTQFFLTNNCSEGYITYTSNVRLIEGISNPPSPTYIQNESIDLEEDGSWVKFEDGFQVSGDFTLKAWVRRPKVNSDLIYLANEDEEKITISYRQDELDATKVYANLAVGEYYIFTPSIAKPHINQFVCIQIRRINNIYEIKMEVV